MTQEREREQSAKINYSTHGWRCRLKRKRENKRLRSTTVVTGGGVHSRERKKKVLRSTAVRTGGGVDSRERERTKG